MQRKCRKHIQKLSIMQMKLFTVLGAFLPALLPPPPPPTCRGSSTGELPLSNLHLMHYPPENSPAELPIV